MGVPVLLRVVIGRQCSRFPVDVTIKNEPRGLYAWSSVVPVMRGFVQNGCLVELVWFSLFLVCSLVMGVGRQEFFRLTALL